VSEPTPWLARICTPVDLTLEAVENATTCRAPRDLNDTFLGAAYGRAHRCMHSIRELAGPATQTTR
jgi:hypothetical protein